MIDPTVKVTNMMGHWHWSVYEASLLWIWQNTFSIYRAYLTESMKCGERWKYTWQKILTEFFFSVTLVQFSLQNYHSRDSQHRLAFLICTSCTSYLSHVSLLTRSKSESLPFSIYLYISIVFPLKEVDVWCVMTVLTGFIQVMYSSFMKNALVVLRAALRENDFSVFCFFFLLSKNNNIKKWVVACWFGLLWD